MILCKFRDVNVSAISSATQMVKMNEELIFRVAFGIILIVSVSISGYYRARARQAAPVIPRHAEGGALIVMRIIVALPLLATLLLFILYPDWLLWSKMQLPALARWSAVAVATATIPFTRWVFRSLGSNVSETILTKEGQQLVTWGPYRWIRHPLYSGAVDLPRLRGQLVVWAPQKRKEKTHPVGWGGRTP